MSASQPQTSGKEQTLGREFQKPVRCGSLAPKPLCIDLFCGLLKAEFRLRADSPVQQFVARWAENPDHVALGIGNEFPYAIPFMGWLVCDFKDSGLSARLARHGNIGASSSETVENCIPELAPRIKSLDAIRIPSCPNFPKFPRRSNRAWGRTVTSISGWWGDFEMRSTPSAIAAVLRCILLFTASAPARPPSASSRTIKPVRPIRLVWYATYTTG